MSELDVVFAYRDFAAVDSLSGPPSAVPVAWRPLLAARAVVGIEPIQFALAGMNAHINVDLPMAVVATCTARANVIANWSINAARDVAWGTAVAGSDPSHSPSSQRPGSTSPLS